MFIDQIYIVHLERRTDRWIHSLNELRKLNRNYKITFYKAKDHQNKSFSTNLKNITIIPEWTDPIRKTQLKMGEIGCALSHYNIWLDICKNKYKNCIILEDDFTIIDDFDTMIENLNYPDNTDFIYLGRKALFPNNDIEYNEHLVKPAFSYWTIGYIITASGVEKLLKHDYLNNMIPIDEWLSLLMNNDPKHWKMKEKDIILRKLNLQNSCLLNAFSLKNHIVSPSFDDQDINNSETEESEIITYLPPKYNKNKPPVFVISIATDQTDGFIRWKNSLDYFAIPYVVIGLGQEWKGGNMKIGTGGGQKVCMCRKWWAENKQKILKMNYTHVIFTDAYDVIIKSSLDEIWEKYKNLVNNSDDSFLFSSETQCWPRKEWIDAYPDPYIDNNSKYLNSGMWIGPLDKLDLLWNGTINNNDDDQEFYTSKYLFPEDNNDIMEFTCTDYDQINSNELNSNESGSNESELNSNSNESELNSNSNESELNIQLDYFNEIFLNIEGMQDLIQFDHRKIIANDNCPSIIHGNGQLFNKMFLNSISNFFPQIKTYELPSCSLKNNYPKHILYIFDNDVDHTQSISNFMILIRLIKKANISSQIYILGDEKYDNLISDNNNIKKFNNNHKFNNNLWIISSHVQFSKLEFELWSDTRYAIVPYLDNNFMTKWDGKGKYSTFSYQNFIIKNKNNNSKYLSKNWWNIVYGTGMISLSTLILQNNNMMNQIINCISNKTENYFSNICEILHHNDHFIFLSTNDNYGTLI